MEKLIDKAIEMLRKRGWIQHKWGGPNGEVCVFTALCLSCNHLGLHFSLVQEIDKKVCEKIGDCLSIRQWNDEKGRTVEDVIKLLESVKHGNS